MIEKSSDPQLATAFRDHLQQTQGHVARVEDLLRRATNDADTMTCKAIGGLITEAEDSIKDASDPAIRDITLIAAGQQVEHHEIAVYGTLRDWAMLLRLSNDAQVLESIFSEEKAADKLLSTISDGVHMQAAASAGKLNLPAVQEIDLLRSATIGLIRDARRAGRYPIRLSCGITTLTSVDTPQEKESSYFFHFCQEFVFHIPSRLILRSGVK